MINNRFVTILFLSFFCTQAICDSRLKEQIINKKTDLSELQVFDKIDNGIKAFWKAAISSKAFFDKSTANTVLGTEIYGRLEWELIETLSFQTQGLIIGRNGFTQAIYDRSDRVRGFYLLEGFFNWKMNPYLFIKVGNIQQDFLDAPLLITDKTFPSIIGKMFFHKSSNIDLSLLFQIAIPDNATESVQRETQIVRGFPLFLTSSTFLEISDFLNSNIEEKLTFFYYYNLPPAVADRSRIYGNTVRRTKSDSTFTHDFFGFHNHLSLRKKISKRWIFHIGGSFIYNFLAPDTFNEGMRIYSSLYHNYENIMEVKIIGEIFSNQSDTSIAYYNSEIYGHNNRKGYAVKLQNHFYNSGLTLGISFVHSYPINNPQGSPIGLSNSLALFLMTNYISI